MTRQPYNRVCHLPVSKAKTRLSFDEIAISNNFKLYIASICYFSKKNRKFTHMHSGRNVQEPREMLGMCTHKLRRNCATPTVRKQREPDTRIQESGCDDFFIKMWKTSKMLCYIYSLVQLNERNSIFFRRLYTIYIDNILSINENHDSQSWKINIARFKFIRKSNRFMQNIQGRYTNVQNVGNVFYFVCFSLVYLFVFWICFFTYDR